MIPPYDPAAISGSRPTSTIVPLDPRLILRDSMLDMTLSFNEEAISSNNNGQHTEGGVGAAGVAVGEGSGTGTGTG